MPKLPRPRLTYANVMVTLLAFVVLGGSAYAATQLPKNSVGAKQLKKNAVTPSKLSAAAKTTLTGHGPQGPAGAPGKDGSVGAPGAPATKFFVQVRADGTVNASGSPVSVDHYANGVYFLNFGQDITHCAAIASQGSVPVFSSPGSSTGSALGYGTLVGISSPGSPEEEYAPGFPFAKSVTVETFSGASENDSSFYVAVFC
jgi:hypothetical protein